MKQYNPEALIPLVEKMIGKSIGEVIFFQRKSYAIEKIEL